MAKEITLTADQEYCKKTLAKLFNGEHHLRPVKPFGNGISMLVSEELATYDLDKLTWLVLIAHHDCVRISIEPCNVRFMRITLFRRRPEETNRFSKHPNLKELVERAETM